MTTTVAQVGVSDDRALWDSVKDSRDVNDLKAYLNKFPRGLFAEVAGNRIKAIEQSGSTQTVATAPSPPSNRPVPSQPGVTYKDCDDCPEMVVIPAGTFLMGSKADPFAAMRPLTDEQPQHSVSIRSFSMGKFEVTQEQWYAVMGTLPSNLKGRALPVEQVSWSDAQGFVQKLSQKTGKQYRLPSEAEWEYAARAGSQTAFSFGDDESQLGRHAWFKSNSGSQTQTVGQKIPNGFGLYDMHGNVWEWTQDCWNINYQGAPTDGSAWAQGDCQKRVVRGGSWNYTSRSLRMALRDWAFNGNQKDFIGLRVARDN